MTFIFESDCMVYCTCGWAMDKALVESRTVEHNCGKGTFMFGFHPHLRGSVNDTDDDDELHDESLDERLSFAKSENADTCPLKDCGRPRSEHYGERLCTEIGW